MKTKRTRTAINIAAWIFTDATAWCQKRGKTFSGLVQDLLEQHLRQETDRELKLRADVARYGAPSSSGQGPCGGTGCGEKKNGTSKTREAA